MNGERVKVAAVGLLALVVIAGVGLAWSRFNANSPSAAIDDGAPTSTSSQAEVASPAPALRVVVLGDSYAAGTGATSPTSAWVSLVAEEEGWDLTNLARGGTGYLVTSGPEGCGLDYCPNYAEMLAEAPNNADVVMVAGGRNDLRGDAAQVEQAVEDFFAAARAKYPDAQIIAVSPVWDDDPAPTELGGIADSVLAAARSVDGRYLDVGQPLAGDSAAVAEDGDHPNDRGHRALADAVLAEL